MFELCAHESSHLMSLCKAKEISLGLRVVIDVEGIEFLLKR